MKIIMDMYGGDNAPLAPLEGAALAVKELGVEIAAVGNADEMKALCEEKHISTEGFEFIDAPLVMPVCAEPTEALKKYKESSLTVAMQALADGKGDAYVGAGSTGALLVSATFIAKRIKGIKRPALASVIPGIAGNDYMLLDLGANAECRPEMLVQFGLMGSIYMNKVLGIENPRVGLINIGAEKSKGTELQKETYALMKEADYNFIGNIEARELPFGCCDVAVADGWTGNITLKTMEGISLAFSKKLKNMLTESAVSKLGALFIRKGLTDFKSTMDYKKRGGAPLLGIAKPVIKAHGSSNAEAFMNACRQAKIFTETGVIATVSDSLSKIKESD